MNIRFLAFSIVSLSFCSLSYAVTAEEEDQDKAYIQCLIKKRIDPKNIPPEDSAFCMIEAGIKDPGAQERKEKGEAWRNCLINRAAELDDGISPVTDISKAIIVLCPSQWDEYVQSLWINPRAKREMAGGLTKYAVSEGVQSVLMTRRIRREEIKKK